MRSLSDVRFVRRREGRLRKLLGQWARAHPHRTN